MEKYHEIRREYGDQGLNRQSMLADPMLQFQKWFDEVRRVEDADPTAMVLATVDQQLCPDTRVLLLKELASDGFIFYTNYHSTKGLQIANNQQGAINFYWSKCARQVRARGRLEKISYAQSEAYFKSRPRGSQLSALASQQSHVLVNRKILEDSMCALEKKYQSDNIPCPSHWGGYKLIPFSVEFFQGRNSRLHDRFHYFLKDQQWSLERLSP
ncbi:MAG: pyridoxamine 5'-phosphate oxidase [Legionellales bacterium]|nr:pyridoxamine 5'-phosphate oxidase [Legionellales bacterium]|tara:strand:- start:638 stop:1276 length:639 start_codon:yes stop_codon:yes gene_type:complete